MNDDFEVYSEEMESSALIHAGCQCGYGTGCGGSGAAGCQCGYGTGCGGGGK